MGLRNYFRSQSKISSTLQKKKDKRLSEFTAAFKEYNNFLNNIGHNFELSQQSAVDVNNYYWDNIYARLYPHLKGGDDRILDRFKILSGAEFAIIVTQPIKSKNKLKQREQNSKLAFYIGQTWFKAWILDHNHKDFMENKQNNKVYCNILNEDEIQLFTQKHIRWMTKYTRRPDINHIVINSHTWFLMYLYYCSKMKIMADIKDLHGIDV